MRVERGSGIRGSRVFRGSVIGVIGAPSGRGGDRGSERGAALFVGASRHLAALSCGLLEREVDDLVSRGEVLRSGDDAVLEPEAAVGVEAGRGVGEDALASRGRAG